MFRTERGSSQYGSGNDLLSAIGFEPGRKEKVDFVYLTHMTSLLSFFHLRFGFASFAAKPFSHQWYLWILWPISNAVMLLLWIFGRTFTVEKNRLDHVNIQTWVLPRYIFQVRHPPLN